MKLVNNINNKIISENLQIANTFLKRFKGLMFTKELPNQNALQIIPCREIHTFFMNYSIDVLYLDANNTILSVDENFTPNKIGKKVKNAVSVIELPNGTIEKFNLKVGQKLLIVND